MPSLSKNRNTSAPTSRATVFTSTAFTHIKRSKVDPVSTINDLHFFTSICIPLLRLALFTVARTKRVYCASHDLLTMEHTTSMPNMGRRFSLQAFHDLCSKRDEQLSPFIKSSEKVSSSRRNALFINSAAMFPDIPVQLKSAPTTPRQSISESEYSNRELCPRDGAVPVTFDDRFAREKFKRNASVQSDGSWNSLFSDGSAGAAPPSPSSSTFAGNVDVEPQRKDSLPREEIRKDTMRWILSDTPTA
jgi:hypothetical protein